jgi:hypothetical protein
MIAARALGSYVTPYGHLAKAVVLNGRVLDVAHRNATAIFVGRVAVHLVVLDERLPRGGLVAHPLEAYSGPTVVDHEVVVYPETLWMCSGGGVLAVVVAPQAVALRIVNVGVLDLDLITRLQARADNA